MKKFFLISLVIIILGTISYFLLSNNYKKDEYYGPIKVNDKTMYVTMKGSGNKTIVMLRGWGVNSPVDDFSPLYSELSKDYKIVILEYFGYGSSSLTNEERTNEKMVEEIRTALHNLKVEPPYVLMPHSMSGLYSLYYADKYPSEVSAIIGLDMSLPQKQLERWNEETFEKTKRENSKLKLNISVLNQWNAFYSNSKKLENVKYPPNLPVLTFLTTEQIDSVDNMIRSGEMKTSWLDINKNMVTNPEIQNIEVVHATHNNITYDQTDYILKLSKKFMESL